MSVHVLVSGSLFKNPEQRTSSKTGKTYATASIRTASADNTAADFWNLLVFSETVAAELMRLSEGDKLSAQGSLKLEIFNGKISRTVFVDAILPLRRERKAKAAKAAETAGFSAKPPTSSQETTTTTDPDLDDPNSFLGERPAMTAPITYDDIKTLATELGRPASTLIALAPANDPFYCGPARQALARWFAHEIWPLHDPEAVSVHVRRLHYLVVVQPPDRRPAKLDGTPYENTHEDWKTISEASLAARELGLVDADRFVDRRAGEPTFIFIPDDESAEAEVIVIGDAIERPSPERAPRYVPAYYAFPPLPSLTVLPPEIVEGYAIEIWAEKSTMNDILDPLARRLHVTLITGVGELSHTHCNLLVNRVIGHGRKTRILYISDFDPAGDGMPVSIARKVEHILRRNGHEELDIRLDPLVLTATQVARYGLPRKPIKDSDQRKGHFEARYGEGAVELDALEAIHSGELARIIQERVDVYRQPTRATRREITDLADELERHAGEVRETVLDRHADELAHLRAEFSRMQDTIRPHQDVLAALAAEYEARVAEHIDAINAEAERFYDQVEPVLSDIAADLEDQKPDPSDCEWPAGYAADESDEQLFQSERGYVEQIGFYKAHQGKPTSRRGRPGRNGGGAP